MLDITESDTICARATASDARLALTCGAIPLTTPEIKIETKRWGGVRAGAGRPRKLIAEPIVVAELRWYCAQTHTRREEEAFAELERAGFETHLTRERVRRVRTVRGRQIVEDIVRPFFPGYGFVRFDVTQNWRPAAKARGIRRLFGATPELPRPVPHGVVEALIIRTGADGIIDSRPDALRLAAIQVGATVRLVDGPFADLTAVCQWSVGDRVRLLLDVMGGRVSATVPRDQVEVVA